MFQITVLTCLIGYGFSYSTCIEILKHDHTEGGSPTVQFDDAIASLKTKIGNVSGRNQKEFLITNKFEKSRGEIEIEIKSTNGTFLIIPVMKSNNKTICTNKLNQKTKREVSSIPIFTYIKSNDKNGIQKLLSSKFSSSIVQIRDEDGKTPLIYAAIYSNKEIVELFLTHGAKLDDGDHQLATALHWASWYGEGEMVRLLLSKGANKEAKDINGSTALIYAAKESHKNVVVALLSNGANIEAMDNKHMTALLWASWYADEDTVTLLIFRGANKEAQDKDGKTSLIYAAENGSTSLVRLLLARDVAIDAKDNENRTALLWALWKGHTETANVLLAKGAQIDGLVTERNEHGDGNTTPKNVEIVLKFKHIINGSDT